MGIKRSGKAMWKDYTVEEWIALKESNSPYPYYLYRDGNRVFIEMSSYSKFYDDTYSKITNRSCRDSAFVCPDPEKVFYIMDKLQEYSHAILPHTLIETNIKKRNRFSTETKKSELFSLEYQIRVEDYYRPDFDQPLSTADEFEKVIRFADVCYKEVDCTGSIFFRFNPGRHRYVMIILNRVNRINRNEKDNSVCYTFTVSGRRGSLAVSYDWTYKNIEDVLSLIQPPKEE